ncbi:hypothetical protein DCAR_0205702 [Daucus carota subsp. sativus]|uniref:Uncharacterized protein n=1 Tax=Daucus carota subsp. sativus TaxID=79200 RepID=A0A166CSN5_DAUCS|nr:hypothetical protein DCAR_0205702 [Daucus carota subsp. sativus]
MAELKALFNASNLGSPNVSDKASCELLGEEHNHKPTVEKQVLENDEDCVAYDHHPPTEKKNSANNFVLYHIHRHLHSTIKNDRDNDDVFLYEFLDPAITFNLNADFQSYVGSRLRKGNLNHIYFMPHNHNVHWILVVIWDDDVYLLTPLPHHGRFDELEKALSETIKQVNAEIGRGNKAPKIKNLSWASKTRKSYTLEELDAVRFDAINFIQDKM